MQGLWSLSCMWSSRVQDIQFDFLVISLMLIFFGQPKELEKGKGNFFTPHPWSCLKKYDASYQSSLWSLQAGVLTPLPPSFISCSPVQSCSCNHVPYAFFLGAFILQLGGVCVQMSPQWALPWVPYWKLPCFLHPVPHSFLPRNYSRSDTPYILLINLGVVCPFRLRVGSIPVLFFIELKHWVRAWYMARHSLDEWGDRPGPQGKETKPSALKLLAALGPMIWSISGLANG